MVILVNLLPYRSLAPTAHKRAENRGRSTIEAHEAQRRGAVIGGAPKRWAKTKKKLGKNKNKKNGEKIAQKERKKEKWKENVIFAYMLLSDWLSFVCVSSYIWGIP